MSSFAEKVNRSARIAELPMDATSVTPLDTVTLVVLSTPAAAVPVAAEAAGGGAALGLGEAALGGAVGAVAGHVVDDIFD